MNKRFLAVTPEQRADRYLVGLAIFAPLVLETSGTGTEARSAIDQVASSADALSSLYGSLADCTSSALACKLEDPQASLLSYETQVYDVQKQYYRLLKTLVVNLDLDATADDLMALDLVGLLDVLERGKDLFPVARRGAATYRDVLLVHAIAIAQSACPTGASEGSCGDLNDALNDIYVDGAAYNQVDVTDRRLSSLTKHARAAAAQEGSTPWGLKPEHRNSLASHIVNACDTVYLFQSVGDDAVDAENSSYCGHEDGDPAKSLNTAIDAISDYRPS